MRRTHKTRRAGTAAAGRADARQSARSPRRVAQRGPSNPRTNAPNPQDKTRGHSSGGEGGRTPERPQPPTRRAARIQQPTSEPAATHEQTRSNPRTNFTRYETTPRKPPRRGGGRGSAFRRVVAVKGRLPPAHVAASAPQWGLQQPTSK